MPSIIDDRVVRMEFDNSEFERNVRTSMHTIDDLKRKLDFSGSADSFNELERTSRNLKFEALNNTLDSINNKFSLWGIAAKTTIENFTTKAINSATRVASAFTIDPARTGWSQYERMLEDTATLMSSIKDDAYYIKDGDGFLTDKNGERIVDTTAKARDLNNELEKLTWFTDETSGDQEAMLKGALAFVNNGSELSDALTSAMGITNWAFTLGQNAGTAAHVIGQLGQALGKGYIIAQDWSSVETANMSNPKVTQGIIEQAAALDKLVAIEQEDHTFKYYINNDIDEVTGQLKKYKNGVELATGATFDFENATEVTAENFRNTLHERWFTKDVLAAYTARYGNFAAELAKVIQESQKNYPDAEGLLTTNWMDYVEAYTQTAADDSAAREKIIQEALEEAGWSGEHAAEDMRKYLELLSKPKFSFGERAMRKSQETRTFSAAIEATKTAAKSAWSGVYEQIFGDAQKATELFSGIVEDMYDIFVEPIQTIKRAFKQWNGEDSIGYKLLWGEDGVYKNLLASFNSIFGSDGVIMSAFSEIFGELDAKNLGELLLDWTKRLKEFTATLIPTEETAEKLQKIFRGFFSVLDIGKHVLAGLKIALKPVVDFIKDIFGILFDATSTGAGWLETIRDMIVENQTFETIGTNIANVLTTIFDLIRSIIRSIKDVGAFKTFDQLLDNLVSGMSTLFKYDDAKKTSAFLEFVSNVLGSIGTALKIIFKIGSKVIGAVQGFLNDIVEKLDNAEKDSYLSVIWDFIRRIGKEFVDRFIPSVDKLRSILDQIHIEQIISGVRLLATCFMASAPLILGIVGLVKLLTTVNELVWGLGNMFNPFFGLNAALGSLSAVFDQLTNNLQINVAEKIARAAIVFAGALFILVMAIKMLAEQISSNGRATYDAFQMLIIYIGAMVIAEKILAKSFEDPKALKSLNAGLKGMTTMTISLLGIALAITMLAKYPWHRISNATEMLLGTMVVMTGLMVLIGKSESVNPSKMNKYAWSMVVMSIGLIAIASAIKKLAGYSLEQLLPGTVALVAVASLIMFALSQISANVKPGKALSIAAGLMIMAGAILSIASSLRLLAGYSWDDLLPASAALISVVATFGTLIAIFGSLDGMSVKNILFAAIAFAIMSNALVKIGRALATVSSFDWTSILASTTAIISVVATLGTFIAIFGSLDGMSVKNIMSAALAFSIMSGAVLMIGLSLALLSLFSWDQLLPASVALVGAVSIMMMVLGAVSAMKETSALKMMGAAAAIAILAASIGILAGAFIILSALDWDVLSRGIMYLSGLLIILTLLAAILGNIGGASVIGAASIAIIAGSVLIMAISFQLLAGAMAELMAVLNPKDLLKVAGAFVIIAGVSAIILALLTALGPGVLITAASLAITVLSLAYGLKLVADAMVKISEIGPEGIRNITRSMQAFGKGVGLLIVEIVKGIKEAIPEIFGIIVAVFSQLALLIPKYLIETISSFLTLLDENLPTILEKLRSIVQTFFDWLASDSESGNAKSPAGMFIDAIISLINVVNSRTRKIVETIVEFAVNLINSLADTIRAEAPEIVDAIDNLIGSLITLAEKAIRKLGEKLGIDLGEETEGGWEKHWNEKGGLEHMLTNFIENAMATVLNLITGDTGIGQGIARVIMEIQSFIADLLNPMKDAGNFGERIKQAYTSGVEDYKSTHNGNVWDGVSPVYGSTIPHSSSTGSQHGGGGSRSGYIPADDTLRLASEINKGVTQTSGDTVTNNNAPTENINITNNFTGLTNDEIVDKVSSTIMRQVARRDKQWA